MSDDDYTLEIEMSSTIQDQDANAVNIADTYEFKVLIEDLERRANEGEDLSNLIATAVMTLFHPSFVLIGSPFLEPTESGHMVPNDVGVCLSTASDLTPSGLAFLLKRISEAIDGSVDDVMELLRNENDSN